MISEFKFYQGKSSPTASPSADSHVYWLDPCGVCRHLWEYDPRQHRRTTKRQQHQDRHRHDRGRAHGTISHCDSTHRHSLEHPYDYLNHPHSHTDGNSHTRSHSNIAPISHTADKRLQSSSAAGCRVDKSTESANQCPNRSAPTYR